MRRHGGATDDPVTTPARPQGAPKKPPRPEENPKTPKDPPGPPKDSPESFQALRLDVLFKKSDQHLCTADSNMCARDACLCPPNLSVDIRAFHLHDKFWKNAKRYSLAENCQSMRSKASESLKVSKGSNLKLRPEKNTS